MASKVSRSKWIQYGLSAIVLVGLGIAAWKYLDWHQVFSAVRRFHGAYLPIILALSLLYLFFKAVRFVVLVRPLTDLPASVIGRAYFAGQPATFLPGGIAVRAALLAQTGIPPGSTSGPILHSSLFDQVTFVLATLIAALFYPPARHAALIGLAVLLVVATLMLIHATRGLLTKLLAAIAKRCHIEKPWQHFVESLDQMNQPRVYLLGMLWSIIAYVTPIFMFQLCLLGVGQRVPFFTVLLAYTVPSMAGRLTVIPGGAGVTEAGMITLLDTLTEMNQNEAAAAAAIFRICDSIFQGLLGAIVYLFFWHGQQEEKHVPGKTKANARARAAAKKAES